MRKNRTEILPVENASLFAFFYSFYFWFFSLKYIRGIL